MLRGALVSFGPDLVISPLRGLTVSQEVGFDVWCDVSLQSVDHLGSQLVAVSVILLIGVHDICQCVVQMAL